MSANKVSKEVPHHPKELEYLLALAEKASSVLEIGSRYGETLLLMAQRMKAGRLVSVDLPGIQPWGYPDSENHLRANIEKIRELGLEAELFIGDSADPDILSAVTALSPFDLVFIDGDHRYEGVKTDWLNYGHLGKVVVFHDIVRHPDGARNAPQVWRLWQEIEGNKSQFIAPDSVMGLGVVCQ
jgi:predicted O-methyltransferase YrrM